jgi:Zn-dependent M28 family amino/carboxypeptidase
VSTSAKQYLDQVSVGRIEEHIRALEGIRHRVVDPEALERAASHISTWLEGLDYEFKPHPFRALDGEFRNLIATNPGWRAPEKRVMVVAHYDTVRNSPGADDNASGVAALLELATVLQPAQFDLTVQFAAVNLEEKQRQGPLEEAGLFGSRALAARAQEEGWQIEGVIVLESIAYAGEGIPQRAPEGLPMQLPEQGDFIGIVGNAASAELVEAFLQARERYQIPLPVVPFVVPGRGEMLRHTRRSDHAPFWDRGYRAVMVTDTAEFRNPHYHQPTDTLQTLNLPFAAEVCRTVGAVVADVAGYAGSI